MPTTADTVAPGTKKSSKNKVLARIADLRKSDPKLWDALNIIITDLDAIVIQLNPVVAASKLFVASVALPPPVLTFNYTLSLVSINFTWSEPSPKGSTVFYEIRRGSTWASAALEIRTPSLGAALNPTAVGSQEYLIKTLNAAGVESTDTASVTVVVPALGTPVVSAQVIDNNVLLSWPAPSSSFSIVDYEIFKDGVSQGVIAGTWFNLFETVAGTYLYGIEARDIFPNTSPRGTVSAVVNEPPDFELHSELTPDLTTGVHSNSYLESTDGKIYGPADITEQYQVHFSDHSWADPQAQVDDGGAGRLNMFIQENPLTALWTSAEMDIGIILKNVIINYNHVAETIAGTTDPTITIEMRGGDTPGSGSWVGGFSQFFVSVRYVSVRVTITAAGASPRDSMARFNNASMLVSVKNTIDGNVMTCLGGDAAGTQVDMPGVAANGHGTKTFSDVASITLTPIETNNLAVTAIYDFVDAANPTDFKILCYDSAGRRVDAVVSWKVRGIQA